MRRLTRAVAAALALCLAAVLPAPSARAAPVIAGTLTLQAEGRAPVREGRDDVAYQAALDEALRRCVLAALRVIAPERQSPGDFDLWQGTVLSRATEFVGAYRVRAQESRDGFLRLDVEAEVWREKLARAAHAAPQATAAAAVRLLILAESLSLEDRAADEQVDAGRLAAAALQGEFSRRGAVIVASTGRAPWQQAHGKASEENRGALAAAEGKALEADAVLVVQITPRPGRILALATQLIAVGSEVALGAARAEFAVPDSGVEEAFAAPARQLAATLAPHLAGLARSVRRPLLELP